MNKKVLFLVSGLLVSATILIGIKVNTPKNNVQPIVSQEAAPTAPTEPTAVAIEPVAPTSQPIPVDVAPAPAPAPTPAPTASPIVYKWADDMASVGIAQSDYAFVTDTVLDDNGWRLAGDKIWHEAVNGSFYTNLHDKILFANNYVVTYYGTWQAAYDSYVNRGNF